jgi:hypothetical protein
MHIHAKNSSGVRRGFGIAEGPRGRREIEMNNTHERSGAMKLRNGVFFAFMLVIGLAMSLSARAFTVNVVDQDDNPVSGFKWLLEEDTTHDPQPGVHLPVDNDTTPGSGAVFNNTLSISLHKSHAPVVASGEEPNLSSTSISPAPGRYFVSVLPFGDRGEDGTTYDMGGSPVTVVDNSESVTVYVRTNPIETAQVSIKVFHDGNGGPLNNAPDTEEPGLPGFTVTLMDAGGDIVEDYFGNPLCTEYQKNPDGSPVLDPDGAPIPIPGTGGVCLTDANGEVFIQNLAPNKYGIEVVPPAPDCITDPDHCWRQLTTIEGTQVIDAWVRPNEPPFLVEFGPPFWHAFYGFTKEFDHTGPGGSTVTGQIRKGHLSRPPAISFFDGPPPEGDAIGERCLVGLNRLEGGVAQGVLATLCEDETGNFTLPNLPAGTYQLVIWDVSLLHIISFNTVIVDGVNPVALGPVNTPMWFGQQEHYVFVDQNDNRAFDDGTDVGIPDQNVNLRYRDGTIYQAFPTDVLGFVPFQEVFPLFHWYVGEVDFANFKATGLRVTNDLGGPTTAGNPDDNEGRRNPSVHFQDGTALLEAFQVFAGQNQRYEWTKEPYGTNENGGISGTSTYAVTRAEDDPRLAAVEEWEAGIPRLQHSLYKDVVCNSNGGPAIVPLCPESIAGETGDGLPDPVDSMATFPHVPAYADVDNYPLDNFPGPEDVNHTEITDPGMGYTDGFDYGDAIMIAYSDSWDDAPPEGCELGSGELISIHGTNVPIEQCAEGLRTWNQTVPGVFDGGWAFGPEIDCADVTPGIGADCGTFTNTGLAADGVTPAQYLKPATYIVAAATPPGYQTLKEEDRNVDFGPTPIPAILPPRCVGDLHTVPALFSFLTRNDNVTPLPGVDPNDPDNWAPFSHNADDSYPAPDRPLCDRKRVDLGSGQNAAVEFHLFTDVPKAARAVGLITDDFANELAPGKPSFTEKFSPPWISVAVFDYTGKQIIHTYGDEFGAYNFLAPSTYAIDLPTPTGVGPKMNHFCLNYPFMPDGSVDPRFRAQYSTTCYTFNFEAGRTVYLDTPVIRQAAFVGALQNTLDCALPDNTPVIRSVLNDATGEPAVARAGQSVVITSMGMVSVPNPAYPGGTLGNADDPPSEPEFVTRDYRFGPFAGPMGARARAFIGDYEFINQPGPGGPVLLWNQGTVTLNIPSPLPAGLETGQLLLITRDGTPIETGVTVTVDDGSVNIVRVGPGQAHDPNLTPTPIQDAIDAAVDGDLILVDPGTYRELPILYKNVALQGAGAGATTIVASHFSSGPGFTNPLVAWREKIDELVGFGQLGLLPGQDPDNPDFFLKDGEGPGIFVAPPSGVFHDNVARIDGFTVTLADLGGGIYVNAYAEGLQISNNRLQSNAGNLGGGIRIGNPTVVAFARGGVAIPDGSDNPSINIHHNQILENGSYSAGGGIAIYKGADNYSVTANRLCGNFSRSGGGAIAHRGLSDGGLIGGDAAEDGNKIVFNEVFQGDQPGAGLGIGGGGGGIEVAGDPDSVGDLIGNGLTEGTGSITIGHNLFQGNLGGSADGGAIALRGVNGDEVAMMSPGYMIDISGNVMVNNVSGLGGGGVSLQDAINVVIDHNTIADNDSTATSVFAGIGTPPTAPQPAGIVSRPHTPELALVSMQTFSSPVSLDGNILYSNRAFYWDDAAAGNEQGGLLPNVAGGEDTVYWDLGVVGAGPSDCLSPMNSRLTAFTYGLDPGCDYTGSGNSTGDPGFPGDYFNNLLAASAADEGGNFVQVYYTPLAVQGDYSEVLVEGP